MYKGDWLALVVRYYEVMTTDPQHLLPAHTPFYKKLFFSNLLLSILVGINILYGLVFVYGFESLSIENALYLLFLSSGGGTLAIMSGLFFNYQLNNLLLTTIYALFLIIAFVNNKYNYSVSIYLMTIIYLMLSIGGITLIAIIGY